MTQAKIEKYIKDHEPLTLAKAKLFENIMARDFGRSISDEDREDAAQDLRVVMYKCLVNYKPEYHTVFESYLIKSMDNYVSGMVRRELGPVRTAHYNRASIDLLCDYYGEDFADNRLDLDSKIEERSALDALDTCERGRVERWNQGQSLTHIAASEGVSISAISASIDRAIDKLKAIVNND